MLKVFTFFTRSNGNMSTLRVMVQGGLLMRNFQKSAIVSMISYTIDQSSFLKSICNSTAVKTFNMCNINNAVRIRSDRLKCKPYKIKSYFSTYCLK